MKSYSNKLILQGKISLFSLLIFQVTAATSFPQPHITWTVFELQGI